MYEYDDLKDAKLEIRLLVLKPNNARSEVECELKTFSFESCPPFEALSYMWGASHPRKRIRVEGEDLHVRPNLFNFLKCFQILRQSLVTKRTYLWIDAICINQENIDERSAQVQIMGDVYRKASLVLIWLGKPDEDDIYHLKDTFQDFRDFYERQFFVEKLATSVIDVTHGERSDIWDSRDPDAVDWDMFGKLCRSKYWKRAWIHQEVLLAENWVLYYGEHCLSREVMWHLAAFKSWITHSRHTPDHGPVFKIPYVLLQREPVKGMFLKDLIVDYRDCECEVLHDKIYAFKALACDGNEIEVDYTKSQETLHSDLRILKEQKYSRWDPHDVLSNHPGALQLRRSDRNRNARKNKHPWKNQRTKFIDSLK